MFGKIVISFLGSMYRPLYYRNLEAKKQHGLYKNTQNQNSTSFQYTVVYLLRAEVHLLMAVPQAESHHGICLKQKHHITLRKC